MNHKWPVWCPKCHEGLLVFTIDARGRQSDDYCRHCGTRFEAQALVRAIALAVRPPGRTVDKATEPVDNLVATK